MTTRYFDKEGALLRRSDGGLPPEIYKGAGSWEPYYEPWADSSDEIDEGAMKSLMDHIDQTQLMA